MSKDGSSDQKVVQQNSEIMMLNTKLETLRMTHKKLIDIHSKCHSQRNRFSVATQTDKVCTYVCAHLLHT